MVDEVIRTLAAFLLLLLVPAWARPARQAAAPPLKLQVNSQQKSALSDSTKQMWTYTVSVTNTGAEPVQFTNNNFVLVDSKGGTHLVPRLRYPDRIQLAPGQTQKVERIYFEIPVDARPAQLRVSTLKALLGECSL
jgi:hypothetical protein